MWNCSYIRLMRVRRFMCVINTPGIPDRISIKHKKFKDIYHVGGDLYNSEIIVLVQTSGNKIYCADQQDCMVTGSVYKDNHRTLRWLDLHVLLRHQEEFSQLLPLPKCGALEWVNGGNESKMLSSIAMPKRPGLTMWSNNLSTPLLMRPRIPPAGRISWESSTKLGLRAYGSSKILSDPGLWKQRTQRNRERPETFRQSDTRFFAKRMITICFRQ